MGKSLKVYAIGDIHSPDTFPMMELNPEHSDVALTLGDISVNTIDYILNRTRKVSIYGILGNHDPKGIPGLDDLTPWKAQPARLFLGGCC